MNMADEAKLCSPIRSTFETLVVRRAVRHCHGKELGPFSWPGLATDFAVFCASHWFAEHTSPMWWFCWDSERCNESDQQQTTKQWPFLGARLALGSALELLFGPATELVSASFHTKSTSHRMSHPDQEMICCFCVKEKKTTLQNDIFFFNFHSAHEAPTY